MRIALNGNPNYGKTTMYNARTGRSEKAGNGGMNGNPLPKFEKNPGFDFTKPDYNTLGNK